MKILELFAGTKSFSKSVPGHEVFTSDIDPQFDTDYTVDIMNFDISKLPFQPDIVWASPPCETFSVASISKYWNTEGGLVVPKNSKAMKGIDQVIRTIEIIYRLKPKYWFIENPRGMLRKMPFMQDFHRYTVTYCQYGDTRMKPTDIWSNVKGLGFKPICKNGAPCHISAPRGSRTGTQGIKGYRDRSRIPQKLCEFILLQLEKGVECIEETTEKQGVLSI